VIDQSNPSEWEEHPEYTTCTSEGRRRRRGVCVADASGRKDRWIYVAWREKEIENHGRKRPAST
jgi:hypothetical protein